MKIKLIILILLSQFSCKSQSNPFDLNLKGNIKKINIEKSETDHYGETKWEKSTIILTNNKLTNVQYFGWSNGKLCSVPIRNYFITYKGENIKEIYLRPANNCEIGISKKINSKNFKFNFEYDIFNSEITKDSIKQNDFGDVANIWLTINKKIKKELRIEYLYDKHNNWILREVFDSEKKIEKYKRDIIYSEILTTEILKNKHQKLDVFFYSNYEIIKELLNNSSQIYITYESLVWIHKNISPIKDRNNKLYLEYSKYRNNLNTNINSVSNSNNKTILKKKIKILNDIFEIEDLLQIQFKTISPILLDKYDADNWVEFDNQKVKNQTKSYLDRLNQLNEQYKNYIQQKI